MHYGRAVDTMLDRGFHDWDDNSSDSKAMFYNELSTGREALEWTSWILKLLGGRGADVTSGISKLVKSFELGWITVTEQLILLFICCWSVHRVALQEKELVLEPIFAVDHTLVASFKLKRPKFVC